MKTDNICLRDKYGYCPNSCEQEEKDVCTILLKHKLTDKKEIERNWVD